MATIQKRNGRYRAVIRKRGQPLISSTFSTRKEALAWATATEAEMDKGKLFVGKADGDRTVGSLLNAYLESHVVRLKSQRQTKSKLMCLQKDLGHHRLSDLNAMIVAGYRDLLLKQGLSTTTVRHRLGELSRVFQHAEREAGVVLPHGNPVALVKQPQPARARNQRLDQDMEVKLLSALKEEYRPAVTLLIETACRRGELLAMEWRHIDLKKRSWLIPDSKNGSSRLVPLSQRAVEVLRNLSFGQGEERVFNVHPDTLTHRVKTALRAIGASDVRLHDLRREGTSRFLEMGMSPSEASAISGHKTLSMLQRYTALHHQHLISRLDKIGSGRGP